MAMDWHGETVIEQLVGDITEMLEEHKSWTEDLHMTDNEIMGARAFEIALETRLRMLEEHNRAQRAHAIAGLFGEPIPIQECKRPKPSCTEFGPLDAA